MANGPALSTANGGEVYVWNEIGNSLSLLDVVHVNQFEGQVFDPTLIEQTEVNFYRGAPPKWLNFHISEASDNTGAPFIERDGYETIKRQIQQSRNFPGISTVKLFHQPGCGGTTMAMKVLWDLRKTFRCAVVTGSTSDITDIAKQVVCLFTAGSRGHQNTVLLLLNEEQILEDLQESIMMTIAEQKIVTHMPVVTLLSCVRTDVVRQDGQVILKTLLSDTEHCLQDDQVILKTLLSDTEQQKFKEKKEELRRKYGDKYEQFHGFRIMQTNFSQAYIEQACEVFRTVRRAKRPLKNQLAAFLSLLNAYVPGSYLLESQCLDFLKHEDSIYDRSLEDQMEPFSHLMVTFQQDERAEKKFCMVHPLLAQHCTELMAKAGVTRSDTARNFLNCFCENEVPPFLLGFLKDMLTKRKMDDNGRQEKFSRLILDIKDREGEHGKRQSASVLKVASNKFDWNPFFPQALARFFYIELKDYNQAEMWADRAKERDPKNSFVADTLGQVHKNHLKNLKNLDPTATPRTILQLAEKAIKAFKLEEQLAEEEQGEDMREDRTAKISNVFNFRGRFGFLQVCVTLYDLLVRQNGTWRDVLTKNVSVGSVLKSLGDNKLFRFRDLIGSFRDEVERLCGFFDKYLTYSKLSKEKDDPDYISVDSKDCYRKYVADSTSRHIEPNSAQLIQRPQQSPAATGHLEALLCLAREYTESKLEEENAGWEENSTDPGTAAVNYMLVEFRKKIPLSQTDAPELHMLALLLYWPENDNRCVFDLSQLIRLMHSSYDHVYKKYFRSRYLHPLFFIGKGQDLNRIVHRKVLEELFSEQEETPDWSKTWKNEEIFRIPSVQERLLRVEGVVQNYRVYATVGGKRIEVEANLRKKLWKRRQVSFYLGFTIRGPVAFWIQTRTAETGPVTASDQRGTTPMNGVSKTGATTDEL